jgi:hypothetical protein
MYKKRQARTDEEQVAVGQVGGGALILWCPDPAAVLLSFADANTSRLLRDRLNLLVTRRSCPGGVGGKPQSPPFLKKKKKTREEENKEAPAPSSQPSCHPITPARFVAVIE